MFAYTASSTGDTDLAVGQPSKMSAHITKRKVDTECIVFNKTWTTKYLFTEVKGKALCLVCG